MCDGSNKNEALQIKTVGETPDFEVRLIPSWIIFTATDNYRTPQCARFKIRNVDPTPIVYRIRTRERLFPRLSKCHGYLEANEEDTIDMIVPASDHWPRDSTEYAGRRHKIMIENLTVPLETNKPNDKNEAVAISSMIFKTTPTMKRMYTKLSILLPKVPDDKSPETSTGL